MNHIHTKMKNIYRYIKLFNFHSNPNHIQSALHIYFLQKAIKYTFSRISRHTSFNTKGLMLKKKSKYYKGHLTKYVYNLYCSYRVEINTSTHCWFSAWHWLVHFEGTGVITALSKPSGPHLNIKTVLSTYGDFHVKDKTAVRTSYL